MTLAVTGGLCHKEEEEAVAVLVVVMTGVAEVEATTGMAITDPTSVLVFKSLPRRVGSVSRLLIAKSI